MSDRPSRQRSEFPAGRLSVTLIFFGALLLLPGICGSQFVQLGMSNPLTSAGLAVAGGGPAMIAVGLVLLVGKLPAIASRH